MRPTRNGHCPLLAGVDHRGEMDGDQAWLSEAESCAFRYKADVNGSYDNPPGATPDLQGSSGREPAICGMALASSDSSEPSPLA